METKKLTKVQKLSILALSVALAMILSFIESKIPTFVPIPGVKLGLANIAVMFTLYRLGAKEAVIVSVVRIILVSLLFGSIVSMLYGIGGALVSLCVMIILKRFAPLSPLGVSVAGGVAHNLGQIAVACIVLDTARIAYYIPVLILSGTLAGVVIGIVSGILIKRVKK